MIEVDETMSIETQLLSSIDMRLYQLVAILEKLEPLLDKASQLAEGSKLDRAKLMMRLSNGGR